MAARKSAGRALCWLSFLGLAAIAATVALTLHLERQLVTQHRSEVLSASLRNAEQCAEVLRGGVLLARLQALAARHPGIASLAEVADEVRAELGDMEHARGAPHECRVLVVDEKLRQVWPPSPREDAALRECSRRILEGQQRVFVMPHDCGAAGGTCQSPCMCFTAPIQHEGRLLGGLVIHRQLTQPEAIFADIERQLTRVVLASQAALLLILVAVACSARRAIAAAERQRATHERLVALGNLAAGVAHEIRNPLNTIALTCRYVERLLARSVEDPALRAEANTNFEVVAGELARLTRTLDDFVLLAKPTELDLRDIDLCEVADGALALFAREFNQACVELARDGDRPLPVRGDPDRLGQVFANIVRNALQVMPDGGKLRVTTSRADGLARVAFADTGPGFPPDSLGRVFEPYFTTKRSGLGLGLALSLRIVEAHGGTLSVANRPQGGALVIVSMPLRPNPSEDDHAG